jgi:hypothetical protein
MSIFFLLSPPLVSSFITDFTEQLKRRFLPSLRYVVHNTKLYNMDDSHNDVHAVDVARFAYQILNSNNISYPIMEKTLVCSLLHDTIDKKYILQPELVEKEKRKLHRFLHWDLGYTRKESSTLVTLMDQTSYHKTVQNGSFQIPDLVMDICENDPSLLEIYHAVRQADLLTSYDVERMLLYKYYRLFHETTNNDEKIRSVYLDTQQMYQERVQPLNSIPGIFPSPVAKSLSEKLQQDCSILLHILDTEWRNLYSPSQFRRFRLLGPVYQTTAAMPPLTASGEFRSTLSFI